MKPLLCTPPSQMYFPQCFAHHHHPHRSSLFRRYNCNFIQYFKLDTFFIGRLKTLLRPIWWNLITLNKFTSVSWKSDYFTESELSLEKVKKCFQVAIMILIVCQNLFNIQGFVISWESSNWVVLSWKTFIIAKSLRKPFWRIY